MPLREVYTLILSGLRHSGTSGATKSLADRGQDDWTESPEDDSLIPARIQD